MLKIERYQHCIIVYNKEHNRGIAFPSKQDTEVNLYVAELQERIQFIRPGIIIMPLLFNPQYKENNRPIQLFLETHDVQSVLHEDDTAKELYEFYFAHAIPTVSPSGFSYTFCG